MRVLSLRRGPHLARHHIRPLHWFKHIWPLPCNGGPRWAALGRLGGLDWGFNVTLALGVAAAGLLPVALAGAARGLLPPRQAPSAQASPELDQSPPRALISISTFLLFSDAAGPSSIREGPAALHIQWSRFQGTQFPGTLVPHQKVLGTLVTGTQAHRSRNKRIGFCHARIRFVFGFVVPDLLIVDLGA